MGGLGVVATCRSSLVTEYPARGEVWWCEVPEVGRRPVLVLSRDAAIPRLKRALVAPCTTTIRGLASEVILEPGDDPIPRRSAVSLDSVESVSVTVLLDRVGRLSDTRMRQVCSAFATAVDCTGRPNDTHVSKASLRTRSRPLQPSFSASSIEERE